MVLAGGQLPGPGHFGFSQPAGEGEVQPLPGHNRFQVWILAQGAAIGGAQAGALFLAAYGTRLAGFCLAIAGAPSKAIAPTGCPGLVVRFRVGRISLLAGGRPQTHER